MKKVNQDPFSNGSESLMFECQCCGGCVKYSWFDEKRDKFVNADAMNQPKCSIQRDIVTRMCCDEPIKQETIDICNNFVLHGTLCPYRRTERPKKKQPNVKGQTELILRSNETLLY